MRGRRLCNNLLTRSSFDLIGIYIYTSDCDSSFVVRSRILNAHL